jgi:hypothetical protein
MNPPSAFRSITSNGYFSAVMADGVFIWVKFITSITISTLFKPVPAKGPGLRPYRDGRTYGKSNNDRRDPEWHPNDNWVSDGPQAQPLKSQK